MLFFYNYAKSLIKCIFIIFAFILICFILIFFLFSYGFRLQLYAYIYYLDFIFQFVLFVQNYIFQIHFYFQILFSYLNKCSYKKIAENLCNIIFDLKSSSAFSKILPVDHCQASYLHRFSNPNH